MVLLIKPIVFLTFSLSSASLDLKVPIISVTMRVGLHSLGCHGYLPCCLAAPSF